MKKKKIVKRRVKPTPKINFMPGLNAKNNKIDFMGMGKPKAGRRPPKRKIGGPLMKIPNKPINFMGVPPKQQARRLKHTKYNNGPLTGLNIVNVRPSNNTFNLSPNKVQPTMSFIPPAPKNNGRKKENINQPFLSKWGDADMDGTVNFLDCNPRKVSEDGFMDVMRSIGSGVKRVFVAKESGKDRELDRVYNKKMELEDIKTEGKVQLDDWEATKKITKIEKEENRLEAEAAAAQEELEAGKFEEKIEKVKSDRERVENTGKSIQRAYDTEIEKTETLSTSRIKGQEAVIKQLSARAEQEKKALDDAKITMIKKARGDRVESEEIQGVFSEAKVKALKEAEEAQKIFPNMVPRDELRARSTIFSPDTVALHVGAMKSKHKTMEEKRALDALKVKDRLRGISAEKESAADNIRTFRETASEQKADLIDRKKSTITKVREKASMLVNQEKMFFGQKKEKEAEIESYDKKIAQKGKEINTIDEAADLKEAKKREASRIKKEIAAVELEDKKATAKIARRKARFGAIEDSFGIKTNDQTGRWTKRSLAVQRSFGRGALNVTSAMVPGNIPRARAAYGRAKAAKAAGPKRPVGRPKGSFKHVIPGKGLVSGEEYDKWEKIQSMRGQVGTVGGPKPIYRQQSVSQQVQVMQGSGQMNDSGTVQIQQEGVVQQTAPEIRHARERQVAVQQAQSGAVSMPQKGLSRDPYKAAIQRRQMEEQMGDNVLHVERLEAPNVMKGEMVDTGDESNILNAPNISQGGMRNVTGDQQVGVELGERPQTNPHGDEYLEIEPGSGRAYIKRRINEKWATGEAL